MDTQKVWSQYQKLVNYCNEHNLFNQVKQNENFYDGRQWEGIKADNLPKPVVNVLQRVVKYMVATLSTNDISISITPYSSNKEDEVAMDLLSQEVKKVIEIAKVKEGARSIIRNAAVDGSGYMLQSFNPNIKLHGNEGIVENLVIDNTQVFFGNPYSSDLQKQPYIIIALRQHISQVKAEAIERGVDPNEISPDYDYDQPNDNSDSLVTVLLKFYKQKHNVIKKVRQFNELGEVIEIDEEKEVESVFFTKSTKNVCLIDETDLGYSRYPLACFGWDTIKNSYLYNSPITSVIPNQIFMNKCLAIAQMYGLQSAFPKIVYDKNKGNINDLLDTSKPSAIASIDMMGKYLDFIKIPDFSNQILELFNLTAQQTKECMGVNDASLGEVSPDNTSAIIALQETANVPLELQRQAYYSFWEDVVRNIIDIMSIDYGVREIMSPMGLAKIDFNILNTINYEINVDIGAGSQYSEIAQMQTLDNLFSRGVIDAKTYIDSIPDKYITNKAKILEFIENTQVNQPIIM